MVNFKAALLDLLLLAFLHSVTALLPVSNGGHEFFLYSLWLPTKVDLTAAIALDPGKIAALVLICQADIRQLRQNYVSAGLKNTLLPWEHWARNDGHIRIPWSFIMSAICAWAMGASIRILSASFQLAPSWVSFLFIINGLLLLSTMVLPSRERVLKELALWEFLLIGGVHGLGVLPGISGLALALALSLWRGLNWFEALRISLVGALLFLFGNFLLSLPTLSPNTLANPFIVFLLILANIGIAWLNYYIFSKYLTNIFQRRTLYFFGFYALMFGLFTWVFFMQ